MLAVFSWDILGHPSLPLPLPPSVLGCLQGGCRETARQLYNLAHPPPPFTPLLAPERFVELDPEMAQTLMDQRDSGKQLLLITNR